MGTVQGYAKEAAVFNPKDISIDSSTPWGIRARVKGEFVLDSSRVKRGYVRGLGRFATFIAGQVEASQSEVQVHLPEYGDVLVGTASIPPFKVGVRDGRVTHVDFLSDLTVGDAAGMRSIAIDWLEGRMGRLQLNGIATTHLRSGLLNLGAVTLSETRAFEGWLRSPSSARLGTNSAFSFLIAGKDLPALPEFNMTRAIAYDGQDGSVGIDVCINALFDFPLTFTVPPLGFEVLVPNCLPGEPYISVASATTGEIQLLPRSYTTVEAYGFFKHLPNELVTACPGQKSSPLDILLLNYIHGQPTTVHVRGANTPSPDTPAWVADLLKSITIPLPITGHSLGNLVKNFTMKDVHLSLPNPMADPDTPEAQPKISALVETLIKVPEQMNFQVDVPHVRAEADILYRGKKLGFLNLHKWRDSNSTLLDDDHALSVDFRMKDVPVQVTDDDTLADVISDMLFGKGPVQLTIVATVDAQVSTRLGRFVLRKIPADGSFAVKSK